MARIYSRKKGKSGSKKPVKKAKPSWVRYDAKTVEQLVVKLAKQGLTASLIGLHLRDSYGIPDVQILTNKRISHILEEHQLVPKIPDDLRALVIRDIAITKHLEINKKDMVALRGRLLTESRIKRLVTYYKENGVLPSTWKYERAKAKLLLE